MIHLVDIFLRSSNSRCDDTGVPMNCMACPITCHEKKTGHFSKFSCAHSEFSSPEASSQSHPHSTPQSSLGPFLDLCASSLRRGHANLLCIHSNFIGCSPKGIQQLLAKERNWGWKAHGPHFTLFYQLKALQVPNLQPSKPSIQTPSS